MLLKMLSKKDNLWREVAFRLTNNKDKADELVQKMYMRMLDYKIDAEKINDNFVKVVLYNLFRSPRSKQNSMVVIRELLKLKNQPVTKASKFGYNDTDIKVLEEIYKLSDEEQNLIRLNYDFPINQIAKLTNSCRIKLHRQVIEIRKKVLKKDFEKLYKNKRLKYKK